MIIETTLHSAWNQVETLVLVSRLQIHKPASFDDLSLGAAAAAATRGSVFNSKHTHSTILLLTNFHEAFHTVYWLPTTHPNHKPRVKNSSGYVIGEQYTSSKQSDMHVTCLAGANTTVEYKANRK